MPEWPANRQSNWRAVVLQDCQHPRPAGVEFVGKTGPIAAGRQPSRGDISNPADALWASDLEFDRTIDGRQVKLLNVIDESTRKRWPSIELWRVMPSGASGYAL